MSEIFHDSEPIELELDRAVIIERLQNLGLDVELADWMEYDDNEILGDLAGYAAILDIEFEDLLEACDIDVEQVGGDDEI